MYKDLDKKRETTKERVKRFRDKQKVLSETQPGICPVCNGKGYIELDKAGLIRRPCNARN